MIEPADFYIKNFEFNKDISEKIQRDQFVKNLWPIVYLISDSGKRKAYVGETTDASSRVKSHLRNETKKVLTTIHFIESKKFNKSATLDIESNLIKYLSGDGKYKLLNGNLGLANHNYYQKNEVYWEIFKKIWSKLIDLKIAEKDIETINNSDIFKYSPYKSLSYDQQKSLIGILNGLISDEKKSVFVEGGAGTGKTILAIYLFKLINTDPDDLYLGEFSLEEKMIRGLIAELKGKREKPKMALVVPMTSFRNTLKKIFKNVAGLHQSMVIGPTDLSKEEYDIVVVDEAHRLRRRVNLTNYASFDAANRRLGFEKETNELEWVLKQGKKRILFYDENQSIKPTDVIKKDFDKIKYEKSTSVLKLSSQFRVKGGNGFVTFIDDLLKVDVKNKKKYEIDENYEFFLFDSIREMSEKIKEKEEEEQLSRLVAGYSWKWVTKGKKEKGGVDIFIQDMKLKWNSDNIEWINSKDSINEVGCIHTTQGYDLNYVGVIFGEEIDYDPEKSEIIVNKEKYFDENGKKTIKSPKKLKEYILNIYKTMMLRGIKGAYVFACNENLREYLRKHIPVYKEIQKQKFEILSPEKVKPFENAVPIYDLEVAAGLFSGEQSVFEDEIRWVKIEDFNLNKDLFVAKVVGESMNKRIKNGSYCLFKANPVGTRNGKVVLAKLLDSTDTETGGHYTVKVYESEKNYSFDGSWRHEIIKLKPDSDDPSFEPIVFTENIDERVSVVAEFIAELG